MSAVSDVLNGAADLIERDGWVQGHYRTTEGYCIAGAIDQTLGIIDDDELHVQLWPVAQAARVQVLAIVDDVAPTLWNDAPGRTKEEVVAALRAAAERAA